MRRVTRIAAIAAAVLIALGAAAAGAASFLSERKLQRFVEVTVPPADFNSADASIERGQYLFGTRGCSECHGEGGEGHVVISDTKSGLYVKAPNITRGDGSVAREYTDTDWVRLLRHGVKPSRTPVFIMPSADYARMADSDIAALARYVRSLPPVAGEEAVLKLSLLLKALYSAGVIKDAAEEIDHSLPAPASAPAETHDVGAYVANMCIGCHGPGFSGGEIPGSPPSWPLAANLTPAPDAAMTRYASIESFRNMFRTGRRPDGSAISTVMPFQSLGRMSDDETAALFAFLKTLDPKPSGQR